MVHTKILTSSGILCRTPSHTPTVLRSRPELLGCYPVNTMPSCLKCGTDLAVNEEGVAPVLCDRCAGVATGRARRAMAMGGVGRYPVTVALLAINVIAYVVD